MNKRTKQVVWASALVVLVAVAFGYYQFMQVPPLSFQTMIVEFTDGSKEAVTSSSYQPFTIVEYSGGRMLERLTTRLHVSAVYEGGMSSYFIDGYARGLLYNANTGYFVALLWGPTYFSLSGSYLESGVSTIVSQTEVTGFQLESLYSGWVPGQRYSYVVETLPAGITVSITFPDGNTVSRSTVPSQLRYTFTYEP